jgi:hypothetical protein
VSEYQYYKFERLDGYLDAKARQVHIPANPDTGTGLIRTPVFLAFL